MGRPKNNKKRQKNDKNDDELEFVGHVSAQTDTQPETHAQTQPVVHAETNSADARTESEHQPQMHINLSVKSIEDQQR